MSSIIPDEEIRREGTINLAPMVDFLFLVLAVFATLAVTRAALYDKEVDLVKITPAKEDAPSVGYNDYYTVMISVNEDGNYKWITEFNEYIMQNVAAIQQELLKQQDLGLLPKEKDKIKVLVLIDKTAKWEPIAQLIFGVKEKGFHIHPVYEPDEKAL
jgi:biopolymer transport protein ExbD